MEGKKRGKSNVNCCVVGCSNTYNNTDDVIFYTFPTKSTEVERRKLWIRAVNRRRPDGSQWEPTKSSRICSAHFIGNRRSGHPQNPAFVPTIFPEVYKKINISSQELSDRFKKLMKRNKLDILADELISSDKINASTETEVCVVYGNELIFFCDMTGNDACTQADIPQHLFMLVDMDDTLEESAPRLEEYENQTKDLESDDDDDDDYDIPPPTFQLVKTEVIDDIEIDTDDTADEADDEAMSSGTVKNEPESLHYEDLNDSSLYIGHTSPVHGSNSDGSEFITSESYTEDDLRDGDILPTNAVWIKEPSTRYFCDICGQGFVIKHSITQHKRKKHGIHPYTCVLCSQTFPKKQDQLRHLQSHSGPDGFECESCPKVIPGIDAFLRHRKIHTTEKNIPCLTCGMLFRTTWELRSHSVTHSDSRRFSCTECGQGFAVKARLLDHINSHTGSRPYKCEICGKTFAAQSGWSNHCKLHTGRKPFKCEYCDRSFVTNANRRKHARTHTGEKRYECSDCHKKYSAPNSLAIHKLLHTGNKPYECDVCNAAFRCSSQLVNHRRIHTGERPYTCDLCGSAFSQASNLNTHRKTHERYQKMLDEKVQKIPHIEYRKSQEQYQKMLTEKMNQLSHVEQLLSD
ncbi:zinc finger protein 79-like isoform X2 [Periplaneta americana]